MKFGKLLEKYRETSLPDDVGSNVLPYKELKKQIKVASANKAQAAAPGDDGVVRSCEDTRTGEDAETQRAPPSPSRRNGSAASPSPDSTFLSRLNQEVDKFNEYFVSKEEELVINVKHAEDQLAKDHLGADELGSLCKDLVYLHGQIVLLRHWGTLNYVGVAKILKKHDKKTGSRLRPPYLDSILHQPFHSTSILEGLNERVEEMLTHPNLRRLMSRIGAGEGEGEGVEGEDAGAREAQEGEAGSDDHEQWEDHVIKGLRQTKAAIEAWHLIKGPKSPAGGTPEGTRENGGGMHGGEPTAKKQKNA